MKLQEKGTFEYLKRKKNQNLLIMLISFAVVFAVFFAGLAVFKSRNNYCTGTGASGGKICSRLLCITSA